MTMRPSTAREEAMLTLWEDLSAAATMLSRVIEHTGRDLDDSLLEQMDLLRDRMRRVEGFVHRAKGRM
jgi:hypothetical protein